LKSLITVVIGTVNTVVITVDVVIVIGVEIFLVLLVVEAFWRDLVVEVFVLGRVFVVILNDTSFK